MKNSLNTLDSFRVLSLGDDTILHGFIISCCRSVFQRQLKYTRAFYKAKITTIMKMKQRRRLNSSSNNRQIKKTNSQNKCNNSKFKKTLLLFKILIIMIMMMLKIQQKLKSNSIILRVTQICTKVPRSSKQLEQSLKNTQNTLSCRGAASLQR